MRRTFGMPHILTAILFSAYAVSQLGACATEGGGDTGAGYWDAKKGNCESVLSTPHGYPIAQVAECTKLWETYRFVDRIPLKDRSMYAVAFSMVSHTAPDPYDRAIADAALSRICIPRHPMVGGEIAEQIPDKLECESGVGDVAVGAGGMSASAYARLKGTVQVREASGSNAQQAKAAQRECSQFKRRGQYGKAIDACQEALQYDPFNVDAKYDLAASQAMSGNAGGAISSLEELYSWNSSEAERRIERAKSDEDFESIRSSQSFKLMTGYVRIALINGAGTVGEPTVLQLKKKLEGRNFPIAEVARSNRKELQPQIWYREGFGEYANQIKNVLGLQKVALTPLKKNDRSENDILVVWGQYNANEVGVGQNAPVVQGKRAEARGLDDITKAAKDTKGSVDGARDTATGLTKW